MTRTAYEYLRAWERAEASSPHLNSRLIRGTCVLETLSMVVDPDLRFVFVDDFGYAASYCRRRLWEDLTPPDQRGSDESVERWRRMRSAFLASDLADAWSAADAAFSDLLDSFIANGYSRALADRLREIVNTYGLDLELGEIYVLPQDIQALLARTGESVVLREEYGESFSNARRAALARWLREANKPA